MDFLKEMQIYYEVIIYTASLSKYADPLMDILDDKQSCSGRLFREHCTFYQGMYVKDLSELGRDLKDVLIIDNSPTAYLFQPDNALPIISWYDDKQDTCLFDYIPFLINLSKIDDVRPILKQLNSVSMENDVNIEYGLQLIHNSMQEKQLAENFVDSPRQHQRSPKDQFYPGADSDRDSDTTPQLTMPDMDDPETLISSHWPLHLGSYNREKKLIRDVSYKSNEFNRSSKRGQGFNGHMTAPINRMEFGQRTSVRKKNAFVNSSLNDR